MKNKFIKTPSSNQIMKSCIFNQESMLILKICLVGYEIMNTLNLVIEQVTKELLKQLKLCVNATMKLITYGVTLLAHVHFQHSWLLLCLSTKTQNLKDFKDFQNSWKHNMERQIIQTQINISDKNLIYWINNLLILSNKINLYLILFMILVRNLSNNHF